MSGRSTPRRSAVSAVLGALVCAALLGGVVSPAWAAEPGDGDGSSWPVGGFAVGDGVEALVDERSGAVSFALAAGGISLGWDARLAGVDRHGFGTGWSIAGIGFVDVVGGVRVFPASGGVYPVDASVPSGLSGYALKDLRFEQVPGVLPARADGLAGEREYAFRLIELGGTVSYFDAAGDPVARIDAFGNRADWLWGTGGSHQLTMVVTDVGVVTALDWSDPARVEVSTRAGSGPATVSVVELDGGRVVGVLDAVGARTLVGYTAAGLVSRLSVASGAVTEVSWQPLADGSVAADRVRIVDPRTSEVFSERVWEPAAGSASGWPAVHDAQVGAAAAAGDAVFSTVVSDGVTRIVSEYSGRQSLTGRKVVASDASGERVLQEQSFEYPNDDDGGLPAPADRPERAVFTHWNADGGSRVVEEGYEYDDLGRIVRQTSADGTVTETDYDSKPGEYGLPLGLPLTERVVASDGLVSETRHELNDARTAVVATETWTGTADDLSRVSRAEYEVAGDGFVTKERVFPQGGTGDPVVTAFDKAIDLASGELTVSETIAAGTELATTTTTVSDLVHGQPRTVTDTLGNTTTTHYDERGRPTRVEDAAGRAETTEYRTRQQHGVNAIVVGAPDGVVTTAETDVLGRMVRTTDTIDDGTSKPGHVRVVESRDYPQPGVVEVTDAWGATTRSEHDGLGRPLQTTAPSGLNEVRRYDDATQEETSGLTPTGHLADAELVSTARADEIARVATTTATRRDGVPVLPTATRWDGFGREASVTDGGTITDTAFDDLGNPVTSTTTPDAGADAEAEPLIASREFDAFGVSVQKTLTDASGSRSAGTRELDLLGRTKTETDPAGNTTTFAYTPDGLVAQVDTSAGQTTTNTYHETTRELLETVTTSPVGETVRSGFEYDPVTGALLAVFDPADPAGTRIAYESDAWGNPTSVSYPDGSTVRYEYDEHGRRESVEDAAGVRTRSTYTDAGELAGVVQENAAGEVLARVGYAYDEFGRVETLTRGNGVVTRYTYTSLAEIASEVTTGPDGAVETTREYTYSPTGTLSTRVDTTRNPETGVDEVSTTSYRYDGFDRLIGSTVHDGATTDAPVRRLADYELSVSGDLTREVTTALPGSEGEQVTVREYGYTPTGQLTALTTTHPDGSVTVAGQEYDAAGNLVLGHDGTSYAYDAQNRLVAETTAAGEAIRTGYWATGQRRQLTALDPANGAERQTRFTWDGTALLTETHTTDAATAGATSTTAASYLSGLMRHARTTTGADEAATAYYGHDRHGNVTELTDSRGAVSARYGYDDYGASLPQPGDAGAQASAAALVGDGTHQPFGYAGEYTNPTGTQHLQVRSYDPGTRRFQQLDLADQHNAYWYGNANPVTHVDPSGQTAKVDWLAVSLAGVGLALSLIGLGAAAYALGAATSAAVLAGGSWGTVALGTKLALGANFVLAVADTTLTTVLAVDELATDIVDDDLALTLGIVGGVLGAAGLATGVLSKVRSAKPVAVQVAKKVESAPKFRSTRETMALQVSRPPQSAPLHAAKPGTYSVPGTSSPWRLHLPKSEIDFEGVETPSVESYQRLGERLIIAYQKSWIALESERHVYLEFILIMRATKIPDKSLVYRVFEMWRIARNSAPRISHLEHNYGTSFDGVRDELTRALYDYSDAAHFVHISTTNDGIIHGIVQERVSMMLHFRGDSSSYSFAGETRKYW